MLSDVSQHDYTWSRHPVCSAVALRALDIIDMEMVQQVRGTGIMIEIDVISDIATNMEQKVLLGYGIVLRASTKKHCLLLIPP